MSKFAFQSSALPGSAQVIGFLGEEALSSLFAFDVYVELDAADCATLELDDVIGSRGSLTIDDGDETHPYHGGIEGIEIVQAADGAAILRVELRSRLERLTRTLHAQMFTDKRVRDVIDAVLKDGGLGPDDYTFELSDDGLPEEHVCQYKESHYDFALRWMQREGYYYYFDHADGADKLVVVDDKAAHGPSASPRVRYRPVAGDDVSAGASFRSFQALAAMAPSAVRVRDYDYAKPALDVSARAEGWKAGGAEIVRHGGRFFDVDAAKRLARLRAEERLAAQQLFRGAGTVYGLRPGTLFELEEHPESELNQSYLVVRARHAGTSGDAALLARLTGRSLHAGYAVDVDAIPAKTQFRDHAPRSWPMVHGFEHGFVDGPADDDYAQLDSQGRYLVKMHFDESPAKDGKASTRIRMMQPHAGSPEGFHLPLRKGTEVVVAFLGGDPDRPVIAGFVPNADDPSPVTSANHTQNIVRTGGRTLIEVEDLEGQQHVYVYTPPEDTYLFLGYPAKPATHYITAHTKGDCLFDIGGQQDIDVGGKLTETVTSDVSETYSTSQTSTITGPQRTTVHLPVIETYQSTQHTKVQGLRVENFNGGQISIVGGLRDESYQSGMTSTTIEAMTEVTTGGLTRKVEGATTETWVGPLLAVKTGKVTEMYPAGVEHKFGATTEVWSSFTWVSAPIDITTSHITVFTPKNTHFKAFDGSNIKPIVSSSGNLSNTVTGLQYNAYAIAANAVGLNISLNAITIASTLFQSTVTGVAVTFGVYYCDLATLILKHAF